MRAYAHAMTHLALLRDLALVIEGSGSPPRLKTAGDRLQLAHQAYFRALTEFLALLPYDVGSDDAIRARCRLLAFVRENPPPDGA